MSQGQAAVMEWGSLGEGGYDRVSMHGLRTVIAGSAQRFQHEETKCKNEKRTV